MKRSIYLLLTLLLLVTACGDDSKDKAAEALYQKAQKEYSRRNYAAAIADLDSLKRWFPKQIAQRTKAIPLKQDILLSEAQDNLADVDSVLQAINSTYTQLKKRVDADKAAGIATAKELTDVTKLRMKRDSMQVRFDVLCGQIRYIHRKQKEK
jgi:hypothetical protein